MTSLESLKLVIESLNRLRIPYMLVGSLSSNAYGIERFTRDADLVIETDLRINELARAVSSEFEMDPQLAFETKGTTTQYVFQHRTSSYRVEVFVLSEDEHDRERFASRQLLTLGGLSTYLPRPKDVIIQKARWARLKDKIDLAAVIAVQGDRLNWGLIVEHWTRKHATWELVCDVRDHALDYL